ncbi:MAG: hypothetical protein JRG73_16310 [Deltaproteobacteria bacterium]|nr:hypothetical protein [Deltaproteobacteria bacterium]
MMIKKGLTVLGITLLAGLMVSQVYAHDPTDEWNGPIDPGWSAENQGGGWNGMMGFGWGMHGMMDFGNADITAGAEELGFFPDGSHMYTIMPDDFDGYHHVVFSMNEQGHINAVVLQPNGQIGHYWDNDLQEYISQIYLEWMGGNRYQMYTGSR